MSADFLVEIGTEELPPKALRTLMLSFAANLDRLLSEERLEHGTVLAYASPRRLAAIVTALASAQEDRQVDAKGPPVKIAFDGNGEPTAAAHAFAKKFDVPFEELQRSKTDKGEWLSYQSEEKGLAAETLLPDIVVRALHELPMPRRMRWGDSDIEFVRPVHWVLMLHGRNTVPGTVMGRASGNTTRGHRFMSEGELKVGEPGKYVELLRKKGRVVVDFAERELTIREQVGNAANDAGGNVAAPDALYEEVTALTEWPVAMTGHFNEAFLQLPAEAIVASLTSHQRYFPIADGNGSLLPAFIVVANLISNEPDKVRDGNERVIRPRLADAMFFWETDRKSSLASRRDMLQRVVYQGGLGSLRDKSDRIAELCALVSRQLGTDGQSAIKAAGIAKCDLLTGMVGEFPELQGVMGAYYARHDGESDDVAEAIREQYMPRFSGDAIPASTAGQILAIADKLDTLAGIFALGKKPSGSKDPFSLRRAALGVVRILIEGNLEISLHPAIDKAAELQPVEKTDKSAVADAVAGFIDDRLRAFYVEKPDISIEIFDAVDNSRDRDTMPLPDFDQRINAVRAFVQMAESQSLAAANKRISNILRQSPSGGAGEIDQSLLREDAEIKLFDALDKALNDVGPLRASREYAAVLARLAELKEPVDRFFDEVMVMTDDDALKSNRLALLSRLREPFHSVADISRLSASKG